MESTKKKITSLQCLRGLAFLNIFLYHLGITKAASISVSIFFVLSGFLMMHNYKDKELNNSFCNSIKFGINKIKKLYPLHVYMTILAFILYLIKLINNFSIYTLIADIADLLLHLSLTLSLVPHVGFYFSLNGVAWFLSSIMFIYMFFPTILKYTRKNSVSTSIIKIFSICFIQFMIIFLFRNIHEIPLPFTDVILFSDDFWLWITYICPFVRLGDFLAGCYLYILCTNIKQIKKRLDVAELLISLIIIITINLNNEIALKIITLPVALMSVAVVYIKKGFISIAMDNRVFYLLGEISSFGYLIHQVIIRYYELLLTFGLFENVYVKVFVCIILVFVLCEIYKKFIYQKRAL